MERLESDLHKKHFFQWLKSLIEGELLTNIRIRGFDILKSLPPRYLGYHSSTDQIMFGTEILDCEFSPDTQLWITLHELKHSDQCKSLSLYFRRRKSLEREADYFAHEIIYREYGEERAREMFDRFQKEGYRHNINNIKQKIDRMLKEGKIENINQVKIRLS